MSSASNRTFSDLGLSKWLVDALTSMAIRKPSNIQSACIPKILAGHDCIGGARTGSGKTIAFAAPILEKLSRDPYGICALILSPTRELSLQIAEQISALGTSMGIKHAIVVGGMDIISQALALQNRPHIVIATPGRLADLIRSSPEIVEGFRRLHYLVLDEADRLLTPGFADDLDECTSILPPADKRQTLLFTATITPAVTQLKDRPDVSNRLPVFMHAGPSASSIAIPATLSQKYLFIPSHVREAYLYTILTISENEKKSAIVFVNRTRTAEVLRQTLRLMEVRVTALHSEIPQRERTDSLGRFRAEAARVLIATDVASRGLDIPTVELVINFDIPADPDDYIHRVGRTARARRQGESISIVTENDVERIQAIEERVGKKMEIYDAVTETKVIAESLQQVSNARREALMNMEKEKFGEKRNARKKRALLEAGGGGHRKSRR
ncbi:DEAD-domain-containing protein [Dipodascopsis tothii]|uniref:DEAD-domain-containing protein n=1 Tax=Dipodascopsis tothii TaxID=44089 RepID=UPI0034CF0C27